MPLPEVLGEITASGSPSKAVERSYDRLVATLGPELSILHDPSRSRTSRAPARALLAEAIVRLRAGQVIRDPGYDGEYGVIRLFEDGELGRLTAGGLLFETPSCGARRSRRTSRSRTCGWRSTATCRSLNRRACRRPAADAALGAAAIASHVLDGLDEAQRTAAEIVEGALLIIAGPGSGKTRALTHRVAHLIADRGVPAANCLAITFTRRAATEMQERLTSLLPDGLNRVAIHTFHSLGLAILRDRPEAAGLQRGFRIAGEAERIPVLAEALNVSEVRAQRLTRAISRVKRNGEPPRGGSGRGCGRLWKRDGVPQLGRFRRSGPYLPSRR